MTIYYGSNNYEVKNKMQITIIFGDLNGSLSWTYLVKTLPDCDIPVFLSE